MFQPQTLQVIKEEPLDDVVPYLNSTSPAASYIPLEWFSEIDEMDLKKEMKPDNIVKENAVAEEFSNMRFTVNNYCSGRPSPSNENTLHTQVPKLNLKQSSVSLRCTKCDKSFRGHSRIECLRKHILNRHIRTIRRSNYLSKVVENLLAASVRHCQKKLVSNY